MGEYPTSWWVQYGLHSLPVMFCPWRQLLLPELQCSLPLTGVPVSLSVHHVYTSECEQRPTLPPNTKCSTLLLQWSGSNIIEVIALCTCKDLACFQEDLRTIEVLCATATVLLIAAYFPILARVSWECCSLVLMTAARLSFESFCYKLVSHCCCHIPDSMQCSPQ